MNSEASDIIKIALVDDHQIVRHGIMSLLGKVKNFHVIGEFSSVEEFLESIDKNVPDILLLDISLPGLSGIDLALILTEKYPAVKIIILSMHLDEEFVFSALKAGAKGYLPKNTTKQELVDAINGVYAGNEYFTEQITAIICKGFIRNIRRNEPEPTKKIPTSQPANCKY